MDQVKEAFQKVKEDISLLKYEIDLLNFSLDEVNKSLFEVRDTLKLLRISVLKPQSPVKINPTHQPFFSTQSSIIPTHQQPIRPLKPQNLPLSIGNEGVPTDKQTNQQTNQQTHFSQKESILSLKNPIENAANILDSLDTLKKEIRLKFKRLTEGEILVFSTLYQLDEQEGYADYKSLASKLGLTESSIRDYVGRLISKEIPIEKKKVNNKNIQLTISSNLKKVASLQTILNLKDL
ncbi:MAG: helix-turn-helix domain-containing protein [Nanoarchaeota archaeon]